MLSHTMEVAVTLKLIAKKELTRVIEDSTLQENAIAQPTDSKLLEIFRSNVVDAAKANGIELKQTYAKEGQRLGYKVGRYAHARQFKRIRKMIKRQRTIVGRLQREVARKMTALSQAVQEAFGVKLERAKGLAAQTSSRKAVGTRMGICPPRPTPDRLFLDFGLIRCLCEQAPWPLSVKMRG